MTRYLTIEGRRVAYELAGEGPLVAAIPGMGDTRAQYRHLTERLVAAGYRVVAMDPRGHGDSDVGFASVAPEAVGSDVVALVDALGAEQVVLTGNSAGAASAVWAAAELGERCEGLILLGPVARDPMALPGWLTRALLAVLGVLLGNRLGGWIWASYYDSLYKAGRPDDHAAHLARVRSLASEGARTRALLGFGMLTKAACAARMAEVQAPALALLGDEDPDYDDVEAEASWLRASLDAEVEVLSGFGHYPHLEDPDRTATTVLRFLEERACHAA